MQERGATTYLNDGVEEVPENAAMGGLSTKLSPAAMKELLAKRERMMQESKSGEGTITDQFRIYSHIIHCIETGQWLRLMVQVLLFYIIPARLGWVGDPPRASHASKENAHQASAGTGKSFVLNTVFLYCLVKGKRCKAAAPTGACC